MLAGNQAAPFRSGRELIARLMEPKDLLTVELRPPQVSQREEASREHWIDLYHALRGLTGEDTLVFTTDGAVGVREEESLRHLDANLGEDADRSRVLPFLTTKHSMDYCLRFPERAFAAGHRALTVLGGDRASAPPRCVSHAVELRRELAKRCPSLALGGWANPYRDPGWQVELLKREEGVTHFFLTQVVSHHGLFEVEAFLRECERQELAIPALFGVFYYRSANPRTLDVLSSFMPVPVDGLKRDFAAGLGADEVCGRTLSALRSLGIRRFYLCNLQPDRATAAFRRLRGRYL